MNESDPPRQGLSRRRNDAGAGGGGRVRQVLGFVNVFYYIILVAVGIALFSLYSNALVVSRNGLDNNGDFDIAAMAAVTGQLKDYENQLSSLRTQFAKFEEDLEQLANNETQISLLQSRLAKIGQSLGQESASKSKEQSSQLEEVSVSKAEDQPSQVSVSKGTAPDYSSDISRLLKGEEGEDESFSACLLVMDDNHRLKEWIAYHYFALPLRHLVVAVDPRSRTSPAKILDRWRPLMNISLWGDADFDYDVNVTALNEDSYRDKTNMHRNRQASFYQGCALHLQKKKRKWTSFHDVDEFLSVDQAFVNDTDTLYTTPGNFLQTLRSVRATEPHNSQFQKNCILVPRVTYGGVESTSQEVQKDVPSFLDGMKFDTLRFRHRGNHGTGGVAKTILDVTHAPKRKKYGVHVLLNAELCSNHKSHSILGIHHYLGSWESFSFRDDARQGQDRTRARFDVRTNLRSVMNDDEIRPWVKGFVEYVGEPLAKHLLQDVGEFGDNDRSIAAT
jgi:hypothetical protein